MADEISAKFQGWDQLRQIRETLGTAKFKSALRAALKAGAIPLRNAIREQIPVLGASSQTRTRGLLRRRLSIRPSGQAAREGNIGLFINVKPLQKRERKRLGDPGAKNPADPYYWLFVDVGAKAHIIRPATRKALRLGTVAPKFTRLVIHPGAPATHFMRAGADKIHTALPTIEAAIGPIFQKLDANK